MGGVTGWDNEWVGIRTGWSVDGIRVNFWIGIWSGWGYGWGYGVGGVMGGVRELELMKSTVVVCCPSSGDQQRPFPQDIEMRCGFLGELTSGIKPRPPDAMREGLMPPEKKPALDSSHAGKLHSP